MAHLLHVKKTDRRQPDPAHSLYPLKLNRNPFFSITAPIQLYSAVSPRVHPVTKLGTRKASLGVIPA